MIEADHEASEQNNASVRRLAVFIQDGIEQATQWVAFEPNNETLWAAIGRRVDSFMQDLYRNGMIHGQTPSEAYFVRCGHETTKQTDIDQGIVNIVVGFAPLAPAEFVIIQIQEQAGKVTS